MCLLARVPGRALDEFASKSAVLRGRNALGIVADWFAKLKMDGLPSQLCARQFAFGRKSQRSVLRALNRNNRPWRQVVCCEWLMMGRMVGLGNNIERNIM